MKQQIVQLLKQSIKNLQENSKLPEDFPDAVAQLVVGKPDVLIHFHRNHSSSDMLI